MTEEAQDVSHQGDAGGLAKARKCKLLTSKTLPCVELWLTPRASQEMCFDCSAFQYQLDKVCHPFRAMGERVELRRAGQTPRGPCLPDDLLEQETSAYLVDGRDSKGQDRWVSISPGPPLLGPNSSFVHCPPLPRLVHLFQVFVYPSTPPDLSHHQPGSNTADPRPPLVRVDWWHQLCHSWTHYAFVVPFIWALNRNSKHTTYAAAWTMVNAHEVAVISGMVSCFLHPTSQTRLFCKGLSGAAVLKLPF